MEAQVCRRRRGAGGSHYGGLVLLTYVNLKLLFSWKLPRTYPNRTKQKQEKEKHIDAEKLTDYFSTMGGWFMGPWMDETGWE